MSIVHGTNCLLWLWRDSSDRRGIETSSKSTPTSSHNSWTWKCISSAFSETPRRGQVLHVGAARSWRLTFDIFFRWAAFLRSWLTRVLFTVGNVFFTTSIRASVPIPHLHGDCAVNGTNVCQRSCLTSFKRPFSSPTMAVNSLQTAAHRIWFQRQFFCSHDWNVKSSMCSRNDIQ